MVALTPLVQVKTEDRVTRHLQARHREIMAEMVVITLEAVVVALLPLDRL